MREPVIAMLCCGLWRSLLLLLGFCIAFLSGIGCNATPLAISTVLRAKSACTSDPLYDAIKAHDIAAVRQNAKRAAGKYLDAPYLCKAIFERCPAEILQVLVDHGADVNLRYYDVEHEAQGKTPLMDAAGHGNSEAIRFLLKHGANLQARNQKGMTALMYAAGAWHNESKKVQAEVNAAVLIAAGARARDSDNNGYTALMYAATPPCPALFAEDLAHLPPTYHPPDPLPVMRLLLAHGVSVNAANHEGATALMFASLSDDLPAVTLLLAKGARVNARDREGRTALMYAVQVFSGTTPGPTNAAVVEALLNAGADVNLMDTEGKTALDYANKFGETWHHEMEIPRRTFELLKQHGAHVGRED
jgi:ankyrin repeat protein